MKAYYAQPNLTGVLGQNYIETRPQTDNSNGWQLRLDQNFNERNTLFLRLSQQWVHDVQPVVGLLETAPSDYHAYNFGGGFDHLFSPNLILDVRAGAMLKPYVFDSQLAAAGTAPATAAGFKNVEQYGGMLTTLGAPYITGGAGQSGLSYRGNPGISWDANLTWIKGNHNIKAGAQFIYVNRYQNNLSQSYGFSDAQTSNINAAKSGNSLGSALLGLPATYTGSLPQYASVYFSFQTWAGYIQDEWKLRRNLTLNLGLRYDYLPKIKPLNGRLSNGLNLFSQQYLIGASSVAACTTPYNNPCIPGGISSIPFNSNIVFTGQQSVGPPAVSDNWGPRIGIAYQFAHNMVVRAGYGLFYDTVSARSQFAQNDIEGTSWPWTTGIGSQSANVLTGGIWPGGAGNPLSLITNIEGNFPNPVIAPSPWVTAQGGFVDSPDTKDARSQQWNIDMERQFSSGMLLSVAYVGSKSTRLDYTGFANAAPHANPVGTPASVVDAQKLIPWLVPTVKYSQSIGIANYHALEASFQKRWSNGLLTLLSYTYSKSMDNSSGWFGVENAGTNAGGGSGVQNYFTPRQNYSVSGYNVPQLLSWSTVYDLPFGRGQRFLKSGPLSWILGNWETNYVFLARSGQPFNLQVTGDIANISGNGGTATGYGRPNLIGDPSAPCTINGVSVPTKSEACFYNPAAFSIPSGSFGNFGRNVLYTEPFFNLDFSLIKNIPLGESRSVQLRFESFNTLNFQILAVPAGVTIGNTNAGQVNNVTSTPRQLQIAAKITF